MAKLRLEIESHFPHVRLKLSSLQRKVGGGWERREWGESEGDKLKWLQQWN